MAKLIKKPLLTPLRVILSSILILIILVWGTWLLIDGRDMDILDPKGLIASQQQWLIIGTALLSLVVILPVYTMLGMFAWKYRATNAKAKYTPNADNNHLLEAIWWGIPIIIIAALSVVTYVTSHQLDPQKRLYDDSGRSVNVQVVALQWKWLFIYPDYGIAAVNDLRMPVGIPVNFEISAEAPMSAFWIPRLGSQVYAMNGMSSSLSLQADEAGEYIGRNSNINGEGYSLMDFKVSAVPEAQFDTWTKATKKSMSAEGRYLDFATYKKELVKPSKDNPAVYYQLKDDKLYKKIMQQFMPEHQYGGGH